MSFADREFDSLYPYGGDTPLRHVQNSHRRAPWLTSAAAGSISAVWAARGEPVVAGAGGGPALAPAERARSCREPRFLIRSPHGRSAGKPRARDTHAGLPMFIASTV